MNRILLKILNANTLFAFLMLHLPLLISLLILSIGQTIGIPVNLVSLTAAWFYPVLQLIFWIYWIWLSVNALGTINQINKKSIINYNKIISLSKVVFLVFVLGFMFNSTVPRLIDYSTQIQKLIQSASYILIVVPLYLFYTLVYSFWILTKTMNDINEKLGRHKRTSFITCFLMPLTFGLIHKRIRQDLN